MRTIVLKSKETLMDYELKKDLTEFEKVLSGEIVQSLSIEFIDNMTIQDVNNFMLDPTSDVVVTQTIRIKE